MNSLEYPIGFGVPTASGPPTFDNACVVSKDLKSSKRSFIEDGSDE